MTHALCYSPLPFPFAIPLCQLKEAAKYHTLVSCLARVSRYVHIYNASFDGSEDYNAIGTSLRNKWRPKYRCSLKSLHVM